jgi:hypothetical protein
MSDGPDIVYTDEMPQPAQPGAWPGLVVQPPIYVMTAGSDMASKAGSKAVKLARDHAGGLARLALGAIVTAAAFYYVPRLIEGWQERDGPETVDLEVDGR